MQNMVAAIALLTMCAGAQAQDVARVISRTPVYQQVAVPHQTCTQSVPVNAGTSGAGAMLGSIAGGAIGTALSDGRGLGTVVGAIGGALLGDQMESISSNQPVTTCTTQTVIENRQVGFNVGYEYAGKTHSVQLAQDPGPTLTVQVTPLGISSGVMAVAAQPAVIVQSQIYVPPPVAYIPPRVIYVPSAVQHRPWPIRAHIHYGAHRLY
jgi:uncharacterized protein YcfJ